MAALSNDVNIILITLRILVF